MLTQVATMLRVTSVVALLAWVGCARSSSERPLPPGYGPGYGQRPSPYGPGPGQTGPSGGGPSPSPGGALGQGPALPPGVEVQPGHGTCRLDADCTNGDFRDFLRQGEQACCTQFCPPGDVISLAIEAEQRGWLRDRCPAVKCSVAPPSPCPSEGFKMKLIPRCDRGQCVGEVRRTG